MVCRVQIIEWPLSIMVCRVNVVLSDSLAEQHPIEAGIPRKQRKQAVRANEE